jgi:hypothetical protein
MHPTAVQYLRIVLLGLLTIAIRYALAFVGCVATWLVLFLLGPCGLSVFSFGAMDCSSVGRLLNLHMTWIDWRVLAVLAVPVTLLWTMIKLWRSMEVAAKRRRLNPVVGIVLVYGLALTLCIVVEQVALGLKPCFGDFIQRPGFLIGCVLFRDTSQAGPWPSDEMGHYLPVAAAAFVIVLARIGYKRWRELGHAGKGVKLV